MKGALCIDVIRMHKQDSTLVDAEPRALLLRGPLPSAQDLPRAGAAAGSVAASGALPFFTRPNVWRSMVSSELVSSG